MSKQTYIASDLSRKPVPPGERVTISVLESPYLDYPVNLDAAESELAGLEQLSDYVVLDVTNERGTRRLLVDAVQFVALFKDDVAATLAQAERLSPPRSRGNGRDGAEQLAQVRAWLREQGHGVKDKGRIPAELQALYHAAHAT